MNYDRDSFLSGLAVGRQLKGWGLAAERTQPDIAARAGFAAVTQIAAAVSMWPQAIPDAYGVAAMLHFGDVVTITETVALGGALPGAPTASASLAGVGAYPISAAVTPGAIPLAYTANLTMEVDT